ncbi:MAG: extensin family protein [Cognatishimia sp.]|uniref:extensin-like domain-containing protein n=1 Tax=Cognatishimia sp. TaxID=2211648 RepID=UPI003B8D5EF4
MNMGLSIIALTLAATIATANAPSQSLRPVARADVFPIALSSFAPAQSLRPVVRPDDLKTQLIPVMSKPPVKRTSNGQKLQRICGDKDLLGVEVGRVPGKLNGCGIKNAVKLYSVNGVELSTPATIECGTAKALKNWMERGMDKAVGRTGGGVVKLKVAAGYSCRTRNHKPGAKISEHGKGRAIDLTGFYLKNGDQISVLNDWGKGKYGRILRDMHRSACGPFGTVLGPNADRHHKDHFHFDIAKHRGGSYCR